GASPRGSLALYRAAQALALLEARDFVIPDDVKALAYPALGHRIIVSPSARVKNVTTAAIVNDCLSRVPVPGARAGRAATGATSWARAGGGRRCVTADTFTFSALS